ncbi:hypothetical protein ACFY4C_41880 [Actinomadura viridis]|uniref:hypothetical protein n=1 Tax=Actinomadura viridis TaxID=58110 RepID=UPI0036BAB926
MKVRIEHLCGHTATADITGPNTHDQRDRKADSLASQPCPDCSRAERDAARQQQAKAAAATATEHGWPPLTGSEKQVAWAEQLRAAAIAEMGERLTARLDPDTAQRAHDCWTDAALRRTDASWWIDHRDRPLASVTSLVLTAEERRVLNEMTGTSR